MFSRTRQAPCCREALRHFCSPSAWPKRLPAERMVLLRCSCSFPSQGLMANGKGINVSPSPCTTLQKALWRDRGRVSSCDVLEDQRIAPDFGSLGEFPKQCFGNSSRMAQREENFLLLENHCIFREILRNRLFLIQFFFVTCSSCPCMQWSLSSYAFSAYGIIPVVFNPLVQCPVNDIVDSLYRP